MFHNSSLFIFQQLGVTGRPPHGFTLGCYWYFYGQKNYAVEKFCETLLRQDLSFLNYFTAKKMTEYCPCIFCHKEPCILCGYNLLYCFNVSSSFLIWTLCKCDRNFLGKYVSRTWSIWYDFICNGVIHNLNTVLLSCI